jgi:hypothetical protein
MRQLKSDNPSYMFVVKLSRLHVNAHARDSLLNNNVHALLGALISFIRVSLAYLLKSTSILKYSLHYRKSDVCRVPSGLPSAFH